ncbi:MAG TPA: spondin domain-containing protein [Woeseiaceae bacterium]|nr:spondin domain-containing protein [Woeseiaceae bacterium]
MRFSLRPSRLLFAIAALCGLSATAMAAEHRGITYEVTITNVTQAQTFTPQLVAVHTDEVRLFSVGAPASEAVEILAEAGNTAPAMELLAAAGREVASVDTIPGLLGPGESVTMAVKGSGRARYLTIAAMLIPTNDTFFSVNSVRLPWHGEVTYRALAYDAGTEANDQDCANIPGPTCGGDGHSPEPAADDEGHIHVSNGFHDLGAGTLSPAIYDWRNPVAVVTVKRKR